MLRWLSRGSAVLALGLALLLLAVAGSARARPDEADVNALLTRVKKVGKEGMGSVEAARAWKELVDRGTPALIPTLGTFDDDNFRLNNWLRSAVDALVEKTLADGKALPAEQLEKFVSDTRHSAAGR